MTVPPNFSALLYENPQWVDDGAGLRGKPAAEMPLLVAITQTPPEYEHPVRSSLAVWLGQVLRETRVRKGLSQEAVARAGVVRQPQLSQIERGRWPRSARTLDRLLAFYGVRLQLERHHGT